MTEQRHTTECNCVLEHAPELVCVVCVLMCACVGCGATKSVSRVAGNNEASHKTQASQSVPTRNYQMYLPMH